MHRSDEVREIAYRIWEDEGHPQGRDQEHWFRAEAMCQEQRDQTEHMAEDVVSRPDLVASRIVGHRKQPPKSAR